MAIDFTLNVTESGSGAGLEVTPEEDFQTSGDLDGNIEDPTKNYRLTNVGRDPFRYSIRTSEPWVTFTGGWHGTIDVGRSLVVTLGFDQDMVAGMGEGLHTAWVEFANTTTGIGTDRREVELTLRRGGRITEGLKALYTFDEGSGLTVHDESGVGAPLDLLIPDLSSVQWLPGSLAVTAPTRITSAAPALKISQACKASDEITVEAWIHPANTTQEGPARIVTRSGALFERDFSLAQGQYDDLPSDVFDVRVRTTDTDQNGIPAVDTAAGTAKTKLMHVAFTRRKSGVERIFLDGNLVKTADVTGNFSNWDLTYLLTLANEVGANRPWLGRFHLVAIYERALSGDEVQQNFNQGTQDPGVGNLQVVPGGDYVIQGTEGGDFTPHSKTYRLTNTGNANLQWRATVNKPWIDLSNPSQGTLQPDGSVEVTLTVDQEAVGNFTVGTYSALAKFDNLTNDMGSTDRDVRLTVNSDGGGGGDKPGPHNTGPYDESILEPMSGMVITQDGMVIENADIYGMVDIQADNVVLRNFRVRSDGGSYCIKMLGNNSGILLEDGEVIGADSANLYGSGFTARRLEIHEGGADAIKTVWNAVVENCWLHHLGTNAEAHADGNQTRSGGHLIFRRNNFDMPKSVPPPYKSNANLIIQTAEGPIEDVLIEENWLNGGNFTVYVTDKGAGHGVPLNVRLIDNRFGRDYNFGVLENDGYVYCSGNVWDDTGELMDINND